MFLYLLIFISIFACAFLDSYYRLDKKSRIFLYAGFMCTFWFMSFLRWECGTDWQSYLDFFETGGSLQNYLDGPMELTFTLINWAVASTTNSYTLLLFLLSCIIFSTNYYIIKKYSPCLFISLLLFFALDRGDVFFVRQTISTSICLFSLKYVIEEKKIHFFLCVLFAYTFHASAILFLIAYFVYHYKLTKRSFIFLIIATIVLSLFSTLLMQFIGPFLGGRFEAKLARYLGEEEMYGMGHSLFEAIVRGIINRAIFIALFGYVYLKYRKEKILTGLINIYILSISLFFVFTPLSISLYRICKPFEAVQFIIIGLSMAKFNRLTRCLILPFLGFYLFVRFYMNTISGGFAEYYVPYRSVFDF